MSFLLNRHEEQRPWGSFEQFTLNETSTVKILRVNADERFSLQKHAHRSEFWKVVHGDGIAQVDDTERTVQVGDEIEIPMGTAHRLTGGANGITVLEVAFGEFDENDIERLADDFGRA